MNTYEYRKMKGLCVRCGQYPPAPGRVRCEVCLVKNAESSARYREKNPEDPERKAERQRERRERLKEAGLCVACGQHKAWNGTVLCMSCGLKDRRRQERYRLAHPYQRKETDEERHARLVAQCTRMTELAREGNRKRMEGEWRLMQYG